MTPRAPRHRYDVSRCPDYQGGANRLSANQYVSQEWVMNDDQFNAEELAESKRRREAMQNTTDDGMPFVAEIEERDAADFHTESRSNGSGMRGNGWALAVA